MATANIETKVARKATEIKTVDLSECNSKSDVIDKMDENGGIWNPVLKPIESTIIDYDFNGIPTESKVHSIPEHMAKCNWRKNQDGSYIPLGIVGSQYTNISLMNLLVMACMIKDYVKGSVFGNYTEYNNGKIISLDVIMPIGKPIRVGDEIKRVYKLMTSFDGSLKYLLMSMLERLACTNGMTSSSKESCHSIMHTKTADDKIAMVADMITKSDNYLSSFEANCIKMAQTKMDKEQAKKLICDTLGIKDYENMSTRKANQFNLVDSLITKGKGNISDRAESSFFDGMNALTQAGQHDVLISKNPNERAFSSLFRTGKRINDLAYENALRGMELANA